MATTVVQRLVAQARLPGPVAGSSEMYEVYALEPIVLQPGRETAVRTGLEITAGCPIRAMVLGRLPAVENDFLEIGQSFTGPGSEMVCYVTNRQEVAYTLCPGTALGPVIFARAYIGPGDVVSSLDETERGCKGYGSTGVH